LQIGDIKPCDLKKFATLPDTVLGINVVAILRCSLKSEEFAGSVESVLTGLLARATALRLLLIG
jgi:hypothetical protein